MNCTTASRDIFTKNDQDDGHLILSLASASGLALPVTINCVFDLAGGQDLLAEDLGTSAKEVTDQSGLVGDPDTLEVVGVP